jgi:hypothetical protein
MAHLSPPTIPTKPIGSIPRPPSLIEAVANGDSDGPELTPLYEGAIRDTIGAIRSDRIPSGDRWRAEEASQSRDVAFGKTETRVRGTALAAKLIGARQ